MTLYVGITSPQTITMTRYTPSDATELSLTWSSNSPEVAIVDQSGCVTAVSEGIAKIYATSGSATATCTVTVIEIEVATATTEYIDEYGVNHGYGTVIGEQVWAPVNCGYHETDFPYGKLYQWGRKYGQGLGVPYDSGEIELAKGGVSLAGGQHTSNANKFYTGDNWLLEENGTLWNSGTNEYPKKNSYDPCPNGWRVPTYEELCTLAITHSDIVTLDRGLKGMYFSGPYNCSEIANRIFLPASGYRYYRDGGLYNVGNFGRYWSSTPFYTSLSSTSYSAYYLYFYSDGSVYSSSNTSRTHGCSVRCLQE